MKRWTANVTPQMVVLAHDRKLAVIVPANLSVSWLRRLLTEAVTVYEQATPPPPLPPLRKKRRARSASGGRTP